MPETAWCCRCERASRYAFTARRPRFFVVTHLGDVGSLLLPVAVDLHDLERRAHPAGAESFDHAIPAAAERDDLVFRPEPRGRRRRGGRETRRAVPTGAHRARAGRFAATNRPSCPKPARRGLGGSFRLPGPRTGRAGWRRARSGPSARPRRAVLARALPAPSTAATLRSAAPPTRRSVSDGIFDSSKPVKSGVLSCRTRTVFGVRLRCRIGASSTVSPCSSTKASSAARAKASRAWVSQDPSDARFSREGASGSVTVKKCISPA